MTPIPTPAGNILAIPVPRGLSHMQICWGIDDAAKTGSIYRLVYHTDNGRSMSNNILLGADNYSIIGTVTNGEPPAFDFDCSKYIYEGEPGCKHTDSNCLCSRIDDYPEAFLSLLSAHGHYHKNPHSKPDRSQYITNSPDDEENRRMQDEYNQDLQTWQEAEAKIFEKLVIIKEK